MEYHGLSGQVLTPAEKAAIQVSFVLLAKDGQGTAQFWGRVAGVENDYLLCHKGTEDALRSETFYSVDGGLTWMLLPPTTGVQREYCRKLRGVFLGNPQYEYKIEEPMPEIPQEDLKSPGSDGQGKETGEEVEEEEKAEVDAEEDDEEKGDGDEEEKEDKEEEGEPNEEENDEGAEGAKSQKPKKTRIVSIPETVRLADFVEQVDHHCRVVPRGAYLLNEADVVIPNKFFEGLSYHDAAKLSFYCHTRRSSKGSSDPFDFLEPIDQDMPKGVWTLKFDPLMGIMVGTNLLYPGFTFYHKPQSAVCGQYYFGDGQRNLDLCFML